MESDDTDGAWLIVKGRRWRRSDTGIPPPLRAELVRELMAARRAVRDAANERARRLFRQRVHDAKVALGERGRAWWLEPSPRADVNRIDAAIRTLLRARRHGATICPSEAARIVDGESWRRLLPIVRARAARLALAGDIEILRNRVPVAPETTTGVLRYRLGKGSARCSDRHAA